MPMNATATPEPAHAMLVPVNVGNVLSEPSQPTRSVWGTYLPRQEVSLLSGHGGTGKSTVAMMLCTAVALGRPLFGIATERTSALFVSMEDRANAIRWRLAHICRLLDVEPHVLEEQLCIFDATANPRLYTAAGRGPGQVTSTYRELQEAIQGAGLVVIDNASRAFGGNEIQRGQVDEFIGTLATLARENDAAVLLLAHVDKTTSRAGTAAGSEDYSGSTAWHNAVRSRLSLARLDDGTLLLEHRKSQYWLPCEPLLLRWLKDGLPEVAGGYRPCSSSAPAERKSNKSKLRLVPRVPESTGGADDDF